MMSHLLSFRVSHFNIHPLLPFPSRLSSSLPFSFLFFSLLPCSVPFSSLHFSPPHSPSPFFSPFSFTTPFPSPPLSSLQGSRAAQGSVEALLLHLHLQRAPPLQPRLELIPRCSTVQPLRIIVQLKSVLSKNETNQYYHKHL